MKTTMVYVLLALVLLPAAGFAALVLADAGPFWERLSGGRDPGPVDLRTVTRTGKPNQVIAAPVGFLTNEVPDMTLPDLSVPPEKLYSLVEAVVQEAPRTEILDRNPVEGTLRTVTYSKTLNFPDLTYLEIMPRGSGESSLAVYARARVGHSDLGTNKARIETWLNEILRRSKEEVRRP